MSLSERHFTFRWKIESKPGGGFQAIAENSPEVLEAETREEIEDKIRGKLVEAMGPEFAGKLELAIPGSHGTTHVEKKFSITIGSPVRTPATPTRIESQVPTPAPIDADGGSMLTAVWKIAVLIGIAIIIWLLLQRR